MKVKDCPICRNGVKPVFRLDGSVAVKDYEKTWNARCPKCGTVVFLPPDRKERDIMRLWNEYASL